MMYKKVLLLLLLVIFSFRCDMICVYAEEKNINTDILLVFDNNLSDEGKKDLDSILKIIVYMGYNVSCRNIEEATNELKNYSHVIIYNEREQMNNEFIKGLDYNENKFLLIKGGAINQIIQTLKLPVNCEKIEGYNVDINYNVSEEKEINESAGIQNINLVRGNLDYASGNINVKNENGSYCISVGKLTNISMYDYNSDLLKAMFAMEIHFWMEADAVKEQKYNKYIVFDEIYPFMDTDKILKIIEMMKEYKVPYVLSVMPIYNNYDYPAMKKFCEILTYAQVNGGTIILHYPIVQAEKIDEKEIQEKINTTLSVYNKYGVYPVAFEAPNNWIYDETFIEIMKEFKTIMLKQETKNEEFTSKETNRDIFLSEHKIIGENRFNYINLYSTAEYLDCNKDIEELKKQLIEIKQTNIKIADMWKDEQEIYTDREMLKYENNIIKVQEKEVSLKYIPYQYEEDFNYNRGVISSMIESMRKSNQILLTIVLVTTIIFISFIFIARYKIHRKFFYDHDSKNK